AALLDSVRSEVGALGLRRKEFEAFEERVRSLQGSIGDAEGRMESLAAKDKNLALLSQKVDGLAKRLESMFAQADDLTQKQLAFETLHEKFSHVDELAKKTAWQMDALHQSREDLEAWRREVADLYKSHVEIVQLRDKLGTDRQALEAFGDRLDAMTAKAPELEAKMSAILGQMKLIEEGTHKATRLNESVAELDAQIS